MGAIPFITRHSFTGVVTNVIYASFIYRTVMSIGRTFIDVYIKHKKPVNCTCAYTTTPPSPTKAKSSNINSTTEGNRNIEKKTKTTNNHLHKITTATKTTLTTNASKNNV
jgi:hypothetical protein